MVLVDIMKLHKLYILLILIFWGCASRVRVTGVSTTGIEIQVNSKTPDELYKKWYLSVEEADTSNILTYRPEGYNFPEIRFRKGFEIQKNGKFLSFEAGSDDKPITYEGVWVYDKDSKIVEITFNKIDIGLGLVPISKEERKPMSVKILSADKDIIRLKLINEAMSSKSN
jgi:hypothetical protein